jgi:hypothetical protein
MIRYELGHLTVAVRPPKSPPTLIHSTNPTKGGTTMKRLGHLLLAIGLALGLLASVPTAASASEILQQTQDEDRDLRGQ